jgi:hypothetical protein
MKTDASALAVSCLIKSLMSNEQSKDVLDDRLAELDLEIEWLAALASRYFALWEQTHEHFEPGTTPTVDEHSVLVLSWLTTGIRNPDVNLAINTASFESATLAYTQAAGESALPEIERLTLTAGVVGRPVPIIDLNFPVWFPGGILDPSVEFAYAGLVEHVANAPRQSWPEVYRTSVLWRLGGIAQGLTGGDSELWDCMKSLNKLLSGALPYAYRTLTGDDWLARYRRYRNVLTHVRPTADLTFVDAIDGHTETGQLLDYIRLATYYIAITLNQQIASYEPEQVKRWLDIVDNDQAWVSSVA